MTSHNGNELSKTANKTMATMAPSKIDLLHFCTLCFKEFTTSSILKRHLRTHSGQRPYACEICGKTFARADHRRGHMQNVHSIREKSKSGRGQKYKREKQDDDDHNDDDDDDDNDADDKYGADLVAVNGRNRIDVDLLESTNAVENRQTFGKELGMDVSMDDEQRFVCGICGRKTLNLDDMRSHYDSHEIPERHDCLSCKKSFKGVQKLEAHIRLKHRNDYTCNICGKLFHKPESVECHKSRAHKRTHACECGREFDRLSRLKRHRMSHERQQKRQEERAGLYHSTIATMASNRQPCDASHCSGSSDVNDSSGGSLKVFRNEQDVYGPLSVAAANLSTHEYSVEPIGTTKEEPREENGSLEHAGMETIDAKPNDENRSHEYGEMTMIKNEPDDQYERGEVEQMETIESTLEGENGLQENDVLADIKAEPVEAMDITAHTGGENTDDLDPEAVGEMMKCPICPFEIQRPSLFQEHLRSHTGEKPYKCDLCDKSFMRKRGLLQHANTHSEGKFCCDICGAKVKTERSLKRHLFLHTEQRPCYCQICGNGFIDPSHLKVHLTIHTGEKPYECTICGRQFRLPFSLKAHMKIHTDEKDYSCSVCGREFHKKYNMFEHVRRVHGGISQSQEAKHPDGNPFKCHVCGQQLRSERNLKEHSLTHQADGRKSFHCSTCGKTFTAASHLRRHSTIHTGEKPYGCEYCGIRFRLLAARNRHLKTHMNEKEFVCGVCGKAFSWKYNMLGHMRRVHGTEDGQTYTTDIDAVSINRETANIDATSIGPKSTMSDEQSSNSETTNIDEASINRKSTKIDETSRVSDIDNNDNISSRHRSKKAEKLT